MRIHTDLPADEFQSWLTYLAGQAGCLVERSDEYKSRSRERAFEVALSGSGNMGGAYGSLPYRVAVWDEWGNVLAGLFAGDARLMVPRAYEDGDHFRWVTGDRYPVSPIHVRHKWIPWGVAVGGRYYVQECSGCGAVMRSLASGVKWEDIR